MWTLSQSHSLTFVYRVWHMLSVIICLFPNKYMCSTFVFFYAHSLCHAAWNGIWIQITESNTNTIRGQKQNTILVIDGWSTRECANCLQSTNFVINDSSIGVTNFQYECNPTESLKSSFLIWDIKSHKFVHTQINRQACSVAKMKTKAIRNSEFGMVKSWNRKAQKRIWNSLTQSSSGNRGCECDTLQLFDVRDIVCVCV